MFACADGACGCALGAGCEARRGAHADEAMLACGGFGQHQCYFISPERREVLLPTLLIAAYHNPELLAAMQDSVSDHLIQHYLESYISANSTARALSSVASPFAVLGILLPTSTRVCRHARVHVCQHSTWHLRGPRNVSHVGLVGG